MSNNPGQDKTRYLKNQQEFYNPMGIGVALIGRTSS
jgi:hypothetical protein